MYTRTLICTLLLISLSNAAASESDFNADGVIDLHDFVAFAQAFKTADPSCDLNQDGAVNQTDIDQFVHAFQIAAHPSLAAKMARLGRARLYLRQTDTHTDRPILSVGDTLTVELYIEAQNEQLTGVALFLEFDDQYLELIPARTTPIGILPFQPGPYMQGTVFQNSTLGDLIGDSNANKLPHFQLYYNEDIPTGFDGTPRAATGDGVLATFKLRATWPTQATALRVVQTSPTGSETGYFKLGNPGTVYSFDAVQEMTLTVSKNNETVVYATVPHTAQLKLEAARSIAGQPPIYQWHALTDPYGHAILSLDNAQNGLYIFRATDSTTNQVIGQWHSIPINTDTPLELTLPIGAPTLFHK